MTYLVRLGLNAKLIRIRERLFDKLSARLRFGKMMPIKHALQKGFVVMDVGVWCRMPEPHPTENWLEKQVDDQACLIAVGLDDMRLFKEKYPKVFCVQANGCALPFATGAVDIAVSNAVLEHVDVKGVPDFVAEIARVVRKSAFISVPDRFCPVEVHSRIPFIHWLPNWRRLFILLGEKAWANHANLATIFTKRSLKRLLEANHSLHAGEWIVFRQKWGIVPVNLIAQYDTYESSRHQD